MSTTDAPTDRTWKEILEPYSRPSLGRGLWQLINSLVPFAILWFLMFKSLEVSYWLTLLLAIPATGFLIRIFIIQHDCGHGSFFGSRRANNAIGFFLGILTFTPYGYWRKTHAIHHASSGDLDHRTFGDVETLTVDEYLALSPIRRVRYRLYRNPIVLFAIGPAYQFLFKHRFPFDMPWKWKREWSSVLWSNLTMLGIGVLAWQTVGLTAVLKVQLPITLFSGVAGVWLFYMQHQFEDTYWERHDAWSYHAAGIKGSSYYDLPAWLHWFTGNIGVHHVHHLSSRIPNYRLQQCMRENPELQQVTRMTFWDSFKCARLKLWDESRKKLIGFSELRASRAGS